MGRSAMFAAAITVMATPAFALDDYSGSYLCQSDRFVGALYDTEWKVDVISSDTRWLFKFETRDDATFRVTAKHAQWGAFEECEVRGGDTLTYLDMSDASFTCAFANSLLTVGLRSLVFQVAGSDLNGTVGTMELGRCSRID